MTLKAVVKTCGIFIFLLCTLSFRFDTAESNKASASAANGYSFKFRTVQNNAFTYGEKLDYDVKYSFITAGTGYFQIIPRALYRGDNRECFDIRFQVNSLKSLEWIYKVRDGYKTVLDKDGIFPWEFEQHTREGNYTKDFKAYFDQIGHRVFANDKVYPAPDYVHDIVSAFYYCRTMNLGGMKNGTVFYLKNFFDDTTNSLGVKIKGKQTVEVAAGKFKCIVIEPLVVSGGLFKSEGSITIWLSDDENKIPVKVSTKILIGSVSAELTNYVGLKNPDKARVWN
jgi:hypothetical protein